MKLDGSIIRIQRSRDGVTIIIETPYGQRGIDLDRDLWAAILADFELTGDDQIIGWHVEYDPAHGDLDIIAAE
jgi:hypothetical protein